MGTNYTYFCLNICNKMQFIQGMNSEGMNQISSKRIPFIKINSISSRQIVVFVHWEKIILLLLGIQCNFIYMAAFFPNSILLHTPGYEFNSDLFDHNFLLSYIFFHDEYYTYSNELLILLACIYSIIFWVTAKVRPMRSM